MELAVQTTSKASPMVRCSFADLERDHGDMNTPLIDGLIRVGETCNLIASPKVGKSWMVYHVALSIVEGRDWFGFPTDQGKVLLIDNELHAATLRQRILWVAEAMRLDGDTWQQDLEVWPLRGNLKSLGELSRDLEENTYRDEFKLIVLDAKYRLVELGGDENSNTSEAMFYNEIDRLAERTGAAILLVHHSTKGDQSSKRVTDVGSGAGAQSRAADCHLVIREHEQPGAFVLDAAVRSFAPVKPRVVRFEHPLWKLDSTLDAKKLAGRLGKSQEANANEDANSKQLIKEAMKPGDRFTVRKLRDATGYGKSKMDRLVTAMVSEGLLAKEQTTLRGNRCYEYWLK